jgi:flagellar P-ring protein precursor FlgI
MTCTRKWIAITLATTLGSTSAAEVRVQDVAHLQGSHTNRLFGYGLVVGLDGTGDSSKSPSTLRALMQLHRTYHAPVLDVDELAANNNVAIVAVEASIPELGGREGQRVDVTISALGPAKSLKGGQLLATPLQESTLAIPNVLALAGGRVEILEGENNQRGVIRDGGVLEEDFFYSFIADGYITLVLDDPKASFQWARMLARSINIEQQSFAQSAAQSRSDSERAVAQREIATAVGPTSVRVRVPDYYVARPAQFIASVMSTLLIELPEQRARVVINRTTNGIAFTGSVTISPTVLQIPGLGTVAVGQSGAQRSIAGIDTEKTGNVEFQQLLETLSLLQLSREQMVAAVEQLHDAGTLHAQLIYTE